MNENIFPNKRPPRSRSDQHDQRDQPALLPTSQAEVDDEIDSLKDLKKRMTYQNFLVKMTGWAILGVIILMNIQRIMESLPFINGYWLILIFITNAMSKRNDAKIHDLNIKIAELDKVSVWYKSHD